MTTQSLCNIDALGLDELSTIFGFLDWKELLQIRILCQKWRQTVKLTLVPRSIFTKFERITMNCPDYFIVNREYMLALDWMADALPRLQTIHCAFHYGFTEKFKVEDGEDPFPRLIPNWGFDSPPAVDLSLISRFRDLRELSLEGLFLNGTYRFLFDFPLLESLILTNAGLLRWDFGMLGGLPRLKNLQCMNNLKLTGDLESLHTVGQTLVEVNLCGCENIKGSIMSLAKFPHLEDFSLLRTKITGDIRDIGENDFVAIKELDLGEYVHGGGDMSRIEDAQDLMLARYRLKKRSPTLFEHRRWCLAEDSPQRYGVHDHHSRRPPFHVEFVKAGPRLGWRWTNCVVGGCCETNWLDPEPNPSTGGQEYEVYVKELERLQHDVDFYQGFKRPPTHTEHEELLRWW